MFPFDDVIMNNVLLFNPMGICNLNKTGMIVVVYESLEEHV